MMFSEKETIVSILNKEGVLKETNVFMVCDKVVSLSGKTGEDERKIIRLAKKLSKELSIGFEASLKKMLNWHFEKKIKIVELWKGPKSTAKSTTFKKWINFDELVESEKEKKINWN